MMLACALCGVFVIKRGEKKDLHIHACNDLTSVDMKACCGFFREKNENILLVILVCVFVICLRL